MALTALRIRKQLEGLSDMEAMDTKVRVVFQGKEYTVNTMSVELHLDGGANVRLSIGEDI